MCTQTHSHVVLSILNFIEKWKNQEVEGGYRPSLTWVFWQNFLNILRFDVFMHWLCARYKLFLRLRLRLRLHFSHAGAGTDILSIVSTERFSVKSHDKNESRFRSDGISFSATLSKFTPINNVFCEWLLCLSCIVSLFNQEKQVGNKSQNHALKIL